MTDVMSVLFPSSPRPPVAADAATGEPDNAESPRQSPSRVLSAGSSGGETGPGRLRSSPHRVPEAVEAAELEDGSSWEGGSTENLTVSVQVVSVTNSRPTGGGVGLGTPESDRGGVGLGTPESDQVEAAELGTPPTVLELPVANPIRAQTEADTHATRRPGLVQITLAASFHPPTPPAQQQLPNLALAALQRLAENGTHGDDSLDDFRPLKKRKLAPETDDTCEEDSEGQTCSICFEPWSNSGGHRIASLKCGHLFGLNCIDKWLKGQGGGKCPQCNAKAKKTDIRVIFAKAISVVDTTERDRALKGLEEEKAQRISAQKTEAQAILQYQLARAECERLKEQLKDVRHQLEMYTKQGVQSSDCASNPLISGEPLKPVPAPGHHEDDNARYVPYKTLTVSQNGGARVLAHDPHHGLLVASKPSSVQLLPGYGLMKYSTMEMGRGEYVPVHSGVIRDAVFSPRGEGLILTAGMDKTCRLTSMSSNSNVQIYRTPSPVWACAWNVDDPNYLYAGLNGSIRVYDIRNTGGHVTHLQAEGDRVPITSLSYVPLCRASTLNAGGLLAGTLSGGVFWERDNREETFTPHPLNTIPGNCTCLSFESTTRHCLASFRPSKRVLGSPHSTHVLCQLCNVPQDKPFSCRPIHQFTGGTSHRLLSRSRLFQRPGNIDERILAAFGNEEDKSVQIWNASTMSKLQTLSLPQGPALDIAPFTDGGRDLLAVLSETVLSVFQWQ